MLTLSKYSIEIEQHPVLFERPLADALQQKALSPTGHSVPAGTAAGPGVQWLGHIAQCYAAQMVHNRVHRSCRHDIYIEMSLWMFRDKVRLAICRGPATVRSRGRLINLHVGFVVTCWRQLQASVHRI
jgi:hypothetical protein